MSDLIDNGGCRFWADDFSIQSAYEDCKAVFDGITDDDAFQECDTGIILYHAHEIMYALKKALPSAQPNACENTCEIERKSNDMISRQAAIDVLLEEVRLVDGYYVENDEVIDKDDAIEAIRLLPSAQPERTGRWCFNTDGKLVCSNCYEIPTNRILLNGNMVFDMTPIREKMRYCPNCGCRMLKEGE